jgi:hypothetical protein
MPAMGCIASSDNRYFKIRVVHGWSLMNVDHKPFYKIRCIYPLRKFANLSNLFVSVVFLDDYLRNSDNNPIHLFAQRPHMYDFSVPLRRAVINCVHNLRDIDDAVRYTKMLNWIDINIALGVSKFIFYHIERDKTYVNKVLQKYPGRVEFIDYKRDANLTCELLEPRDMRNCIETYGFLFHHTLNNFHERIMTNDCKIKLLIIK